MSVGTTFKLGFDGTSVARGLGGITKTLGKVGGQIGIGMARQVGAKMTDTLGRVLSAVPELLGNTLDWSGELQDTSQNLDVTTTKLVELGEALRLGGAEGLDTNRMIITLAKNLEDAGEAATGASEGLGSLMDSPASYAAMSRHLESIKDEATPAAEALKKLGLNAADFKGLKPDESFAKIGKRIQELGSSMNTGQIANILSELFGGKISTKLVGFFRSFDSNMQQAQNNVAGLAAWAKDGAGALDDFGDALGRFETFKRSLGTIALDEISTIFGGGEGINKIFDDLDPEKFRQPIHDFMKMLHDSWSYMMENGIGNSVKELLREAGKAFGEGIKSNFNGTGLIKGLFSSNPSSSSTAMNGSDPALQKTNDILGDIRREVGVAKFA